MRHLWSFLAGVVAAPLSWILIALGQDESARTVTNWVDIGTFNTANMIEPAVYLAVAGIVLGLLGTLRVSPVGPLIAGLLLAGPYVWLLFAPFTVRDRVPTGWKVFGDPLQLRPPLDNGTLFLIGLLLLMATVSAQRWRRWPAGETPPPATGDGDGPADGVRPAKDWSMLGPVNPEVDTAQVTLGYPDPQPAPATPRREGGSPWTEPPRPAQRRDGAAR